MGEPRVQVGPCTSDACQLTWHDSRAGTACIPAYVQLPWQLNCVPKLALTARADLEVSIGKSKATFASNQWFGLTNLKTDVETDNGLDLFPFDT